MQLAEDVITTLRDFVPEADLRKMRVVTGRPWGWLPVILKKSAVTFAPFVIFRDRRLRTGDAKGLALIAHEAVHIGQVRELGWKFYPRYLWGQFRCGFQHGKHAMEIPGIMVQREARRVLESRGGGGTW